jgi:predicted RNase H-like HicB family nuclease
MKYCAIIVKSPRNWGAYVPDLPGCVATAPTSEAAERAIREAIEFHLQGLAEDGGQIPEASAYAIDVDVSAAARSNAKRVS